MIVFSYIILASFFCIEVLIVLDSAEPRFDDSTELLHFKPGMDVLIK